MNAPALPQNRDHGRSHQLGLLASLAVATGIAALAASAAYAGADATFAPALTKFTYNMRSLYVRI